MKHTEEQIKNALDQVNSFDHMTMCKMWRFHEAGSIFFDGRTPVSRAFADRLFKHFGGFTPEISKAIGWEKR